MWYSAGGFICIWWNNLLSSDPPLVNSALELKREDILKLCCCLKKGKSAVQFEGPVETISKFSDIRNSESDVF